MTALTTSTRLRSDEAHLVAECRPCGLTLRQLDGFDRDVAIGTLFLHHPSSIEAVHRPDLPAGWMATEG